MSKPHKGKIEDWYKIPHSAKMWAKTFPEDPPVLGYTITGTPVNHPNFTGFIQTSPVVKHEGNVVETLNSIYELGAPHATRTQT